MPLVSVELLFFSILRQFYYRPLLFFWFFIHPDIVLPTCSYSGSYISWISSQHALGGSQGNTLNWRAVHRSGSDLMRAPVIWGGIPPLGFGDCVSLHSPLRGRKLCKQLMPLFLLCQDMQLRVVHLVALHGQRHCHGTNWPHWSDTKCFVSFVSQVPTCASQNKLSCNVAAQKNVGACRGPAPPLKGNKCSIAEMYCGFGRLPGSDTSGMVGELKACGVIVCSISRGHSRRERRRKKKVEVSLHWRPLIYFLSDFMSLWTCETVTALCYLQTSSSRNSLCLL